MKQEIAPKDSRRAQAFELWMKSPMPMVTLTKTDTGGQHVLPKLFHR